MALTFGGSTNHALSTSGLITAGATLRTSLVTGWFYPTTLTATRKLWGFGATIGAEIDTTTDELRLRTDNTTDGQWTTTGVDLAVDTWTFVAVMLSTNNTGPAAAWRVWRGSAEQAPQECTVSVAVSPSGNFTGSASFAIGNSGSANASFQGDIEGVFWICTSATIGVTTHPFNQATYGTITNAEAQLAYERYVLPLWATGQPDIGNQPTAATVYYDAHMSSALPSTNAGPQWNSMNRTDATNVWPVITTNTGPAPYSERRSPRAWHTRQLRSPEQVRR